MSILQKIDPAMADCQALVLAPTRELAQQIVKVVRALGDYMQLQVKQSFRQSSRTRVNGRSCVVIKGGTEIGRAWRHKRPNVDICKPICLKVGDAKT